jgi:YegS/Rv2252/BmrU family lipid kinase
MRLATLIVNPAAGRARLLRTQLPAIAASLAQHGYEADVAETTQAADSASELAAAAARTSSLVLACGGDGTVHGVVQGLAHSDAVLGIVPIGTANALARNLGIPLDPQAAVARLMTYKPKRIPLGEIETAAGTRLFAVMAGCGPDGLLIHELSSEGGARLKARFGRVAYYVHAARLFMMRRWPRFNVDVRVANEWTALQAVAVMASRVPDLGGVFSGTTRRARLTDGQLHLQLLRAPAWVSLPAWMICGRLGLRSPWVRTMDVDELRCAGEGIYAQADAEPMGPLPMRLRVVPDALWLLMGER